MVWNLSTQSHSLLLLLFLFFLKLLGRQKEYRDFVKRGKEDASIEIELKGQSDATPNYIIKRILKASSNNTSWKLNGECVS